MQLCRRPGLIPKKKGAYHQMLQGSSCSNEWNSWLARAASGRAPIHSNSKLQLTWIDAIWIWCKMVRVLITHLSLLVYIYQYIHHIWYICNLFGIIWLSSYWFRFAQHGSLSTQAAATNGAVEEVVAVPDLVRCKLMSSLRFQA